MLNKIGIFTFLEALGLTFLIATLVPPVAAALNTIKFPVKIWSIDIPFLYVVPSAVLALFARVVRLHDKLSDALRIRQTFDIYRVLSPLAGAVGYPVSPSFRRLLVEKRKKIMQKTFYAYASFEEPKISKALVLSAIDAWTWYWILLELLFLLLLSSGTLLFFGAYRPAAYSLAGTCILLIVFYTVFDVCGKKADHQIDDIVSDDTKRKAIEQTFRNLEGGHA